MSQSSSRSFGHRRCSSTPPHNPRLGRKTSSFLSMACEIFAPAGTHTECKDPAASGQGRPEIHYTYSFRRAEHTKSWVMPPPYEPLYPTQNNDISYTFSPTRRRSGELSPTLTTQGTPGACPPLLALKAEGDRTLLQSPQWFRPCPVQRAQWRIFHTALRSLPYLNIRMIKLLGLSCRPLSLLHSFIGQVNLASRLLKMKLPARTSSTIFL